MNTSICTEANTNKNATSASRAQSDSNFHRPPSRTLLLPLALMTTLAWSQDSLLMIDNPARRMEAQAETQRRTSLTASAFVANDMVPISKFEDDPWPQNYRSRSGENLAIGHLKLELSANQGPWTAGYFHREDWRLRGNRDTIDAYALGRREQLSGLNRTFNLDYETTGFSAYGLKIGYVWRHANKTGRGLTAGVSASMMRGGAVRVESAQGSVISLANSGSLNGMRNLSYSGLDVVPGAKADGFNDFTPAAPQSTDSGFGYGLDIGISYLFDNGASLSFAANDLLAQIEWDRVPRIEQNITNLTEPFVFSGKGGATFTRNNLYTAVTLKLKPKIMLEGAQPISENLNLRVRLENIEDLWLPQMGIRYTPRPDWRLSLNYETRFKSVGMGLNWKNLSLALTSKNLSLDKSEALGFSAGFLLNF